MLVGRSVDEEVGCGKEKVLELGGHGEEEEDGDSGGNGEG